MKMMMAKLCMLKFYIVLLKLDKFINELKETLEDDANREEIDIYDAPDIVHEENTYQAADKKTIRDAVKAAWSLPEELQRKAIKRLFLQYHPDKNPGNPYATANFQLLQREIERMEMEFQNKNMILLEHSEVLDLKIQDGKAALINGVGLHIHIVGTEQEIEEHQWEECLVGGIYQHQTRTMVKLKDGLSKQSMIMQLYLH